MRQQFISALLWMVVFCSPCLGPAQTKSNFLFFAKDLGQEVRVEVLESEIPYIPLSIEEKETRLKGAPAGAGIIEPTKAYRYDFLLIVGQDRWKIWSKEHYVADLGNIPQWFKVFDAFLTNKTLFILLKIGPRNLVQPIVVEGVPNPTPQDPELVYTDIISNGRFAVEGAFVVGTNDIPDVKLRYSEGGEWLWKRIHGKWVQSGMLGTNAVARLADTSAQ